MSLAKRNRETLISLIRKFEKDERHGPCVALTEAARYNLESEVRRLIDSGVSVNCRNPQGVTPLMVGVLDYRTALPKLLLSFGADVNATCDLGRTALMCMLWGMPCKNETKAIKAISVLLEAGADPFIKDVDGVTAYDLAKTRYSENVCNILLAAKKDQEA